jgi:hypothetical protein
MSRWSACIPLCLGVYHRSIPSSFRVETGTTRNRASSSPSLSESTDSECRRSLLLHWADLARLRNPPGSYWAVWGAVPWDEHHRLGACGGALMGRGEGAARILPGKRGKREDNCCSGSTSGGDSASCGLSERGGAARSGCKTNGGGITG